jgi:hypothetical protein
MENGAGARARTRGAGEPHDELVLEATMDARGESGAPRFLPAQSAGQKREREREPERAASVSARTVSAHPGSGPRRERKVPKLTSDEDDEGASGLPGQGGPVEFAEWLRWFQRGVEWFAFTIKRWTDSELRDYRTLTAHFLIPGAWKMAVLVLKTAECCGSNCGVADFVANVLREYELPIEKIVAVTSDELPVQLPANLAPNVFQVPFGTNL